MCPLFGDSTVYMNLRSVYQPVYSDQPMLGCVSLFQVFESDVLIPNLHIPSTVKPTRGVVVEL